jgi:hypothetical protein
MKIQQFIGQVLPLLFFYSFFAFPDEILSASITPLGRLIATLAIVFYTTIHPMYGLAMCVMVIFYYQLDCVEGFSAFSNDYNKLLTSGSLHSKLLDYMFAPGHYDYSSHPREFTSAVESQVTREPYTNMAADFRKEHCDQGALTFKSQHVRNENATLIFPQLSFTDNTCNPCDENCGISIITRLQMQEDITYPKTNTDWVSNIWETWFSDDKTPPYAHTKIAQTYSNFDA